MSTGGLLYLLMTIAGMTIFALNLAYHSWQQTNADKRRAAASAATQHAAPPVGAHLA